MTRTLILSDLHFCKRGSDVHCVEQLRPLWQGVHHLILNGDTAETHSKKYAEKSVPLLESLLKATNEDGVKTTLLCGNHDPDVSDVEHLWFCNNQILVFHGHAAFEGLAPWSWRSKHIARVRKEHLLETGDGFDEQLAAVRRASIESASGGFHQHRPSIAHMMALAIPSALHVLHAWWRFPSFTAAWVDKYAPSAKFIVTGHTHHAGVWVRNNRIIINTGCFGVAGFPSRPRAVVIEENVLQVHRLHKSNGTYSLGRMCASWSA